MYGQGRGERTRFSDQPSHRDDRSHYGEQDFRDTSYGTPANSGREANLDRGDYGRDANLGTQGWARDGAQGYGRYSGDRDRHPERQYGIRGGAGYGVYDIGGQGAAGYRRLSNNTYDDMDFGTRHWGRGEYEGGDRRRGGHEESFLERVGEAVGKFFGKGPKGYKRSDDRIKEDVNEALYVHHDIDASDIEVQVSDGVLTLSGTVDSRRTKRLVEDVVERISGVKDVINHLRSKQFSNSSETTSEMGYPAPDDTSRH